MLDTRVYEVDFVDGGRAELGQMQLQRTCTHSAMWIETSSN